MLVDETAHLTSTAARRLRAIQEFSSMGAGFSLAMRDLEIRGAGNLLGTQQSGHIATVGYELYCRLLEQAVRGIKALPPAEPPPVTIDLPGDAWLPREYIADFRAKIDVYRRLARATDDGQIDDLEKELSDRFGPLPVEAGRLLDFARLRVAAVAHGIDSIRRQQGLVVLGHHDRRAMLALRTGGSATGSRLRIVDDRTAALPVEQGVFAAPDRLLEAVRTVLRPPREAPYSPRPPSRKAPP
jgi:transcription-repair coupling factor (superfamily II helicase)